MIGSIVRTILKPIVDTIVEEHSIPDSFEEGDALLLESGDYLLLESGDKLILE